MTNSVRVFLLTDDIVKRMNRRYGCTRIANETSSRLAAEYCAILAELCPPYYYYYCRGHLSINAFNLRVKLHLQIL